MRPFGLLLLVAGVVGFFYCSSRLAGFEPVPPGTDLGDYVRYEAGQWELGRFGAAVAGLVGLLLALLAKR